MSDRLMLNDYGRQCYDAGYAAAKTLRDAKITELQLALDEMNTLATNNWADVAAAAEAKTARLTQALKDIAGCPLPVFTMNGDPYVPKDNAEYLRSMAKDALAEEKV